MSEIMGAIFDDKLGNVRTCFPGKVNSFDDDKKVVEIEFQIDRGRDEIGNSLTPQPIPGVPVIFPGVYWEVQPGETGLTIVSWLNIQNWLLTGALQPPEDTGVHELSSCMFLPGLWPFPTAQAMVLPTGAKVIPLGPGLDRLLLVSAAASQGVIRGTDFLSHFDDKLIAENAWVTAVASLLAPALDGPANTYKIAIDAFRALFSADTSSEVFIP
jgi:hypothetical protein